LKGIKAFIEKNGGETAFAGLTTEQVCNVEFIKHLTEASKESFCTTFADQGSEMIAQATIFVSHAWRHEFLDVVAALEDWDEHQSVRAVFWFDIFSVNQHDTIVRDFTWWSTTFKDSVKKLGHTLLVLEWDDPKPLSRAWCLWEIASTVDTKSVFQVLMSPKNQGSFSRTLVDNFDRIIYKTCNVDLAKAEAFKVSDRNNIRKAVKAMGGGVR